MASRSSHSGSGNGDRDEEIIASLEEPSSVGRSVGEIRSDNDRSRERSQVERSEPSVVVRQENPPVAQIPIVVPTPTPTPVEAIQLLYEIVRQVQVMPPLPPIVPRPVGLSFQPSGSTVYSTGKTTCQLGKVGKGKGKSKFPWPPRQRTRPVGSVASNPTRPFGMPMIPSDKRQRGLCFGCGKSNHYRRECPQRKTVSGLNEPMIQQPGASTPVRPSVRPRGICFGCGSPNHFRRDCPHRAARVGCNEPVVQQSVATAPGYARRSRLVSVTPVVTSEGQTSGAQTVAQVDASTQTEGKESSDEDEET